MRYSLALGAVVAVFLLATLFLLIWVDTQRPMLDSTLNQPFLPAAFPTPSEPPTPFPAVDLPSSPGFINTAGMSVRSEVFTFHFPSRMKYAGPQTHEDGPEEQKDDARTNELALAGAIWREMQAEEIEQLGAMQNN